VKTTTRFALILIACCLGGCSGFLQNISPFGSNPGKPAAGTPESTNEQVRHVVDQVKTAGERNELSSVAVDLPRQPLEAIIRYDLTYPESCGGHRFRLYESDGIQVLEYVYTSLDNREFEIRDYIQGPGPFVEAGLWSAYDHTADTIDDMNLQYEQRGTGAIIGTYSRGAVSSLPDEQKRILAMAYENALADVETCT